MPPCPSGSAQTIRFDGVQGLATIEAAHAALRAALAQADQLGADQLEVDLTGVDDADLSFLQLLVSLQRSAAAAGKAVRCVAAAAGPLAAAAGRAGLAAGTLFVEP